MRKRPLLLDLFSGAGGCAMGYYRAGFDVVGVDNRPQPHYPFRFIQADALLYLYAQGRKYDAVHASPPCQRYSIANNIAKRTDHPDLIHQVRDLVLATQKPFVIENVPRAPLKNPIIVCGLALGLAVKRRRLFESNFPLTGTKCPKGHRDEYVSVCGHAVGVPANRKWVTVCGGGAGNGPSTDGHRRRRADVALARQAMGIDWMTRDELAQAIPPAYTEHVGRQLLAAMRQA